MPASFKVRSVPLDGNSEAFEEVLDPDFGESAIGRVAPVDSVTDGSCMIDRRMGIHGHPLEIQFTLACIKMGRRDLARRAVEVAEKRLSNDKWPEYYDTRTGSQLKLIGSFVNKQHLTKAWFGKGARSALYCT
ncbi:hypothetical protein PR202_gb19675 [Eleusine coracana subsp. coracana]|uniref:Uncharacterized protein n=1 Tax=Eleusine coracana subsp. coracana TaxID=191504 RepID=A0AAV5F8U1_ELECO|nr:hypothetical protein PR202_gb19675 [Eleusine coracana subsp. coracana]